LSTQKKNDTQKLQESFSFDDIYSKLHTRFTLILSILTIVFIAVVVFNIFYFKTITTQMYQSYISNTKEIITTQTKIAFISDWERLPINQKKEKLREKYYEIMKYYTIDIPLNQKMSETQILNSFNTLFSCVQASSSHINFFLPLAYIKVKTNFNPNFSKQYKYGISAFYIKEGKNISNLPIVQNTDEFRVAYKGKITLQNPTDSIKLLVAKIDDLMNTFNNREDWVVFALLRNEYYVIEKYWNDGKGKIPDSFYKEGKLHDILEYFYAFRDFKIIPTK